MLQAWPATASCYVCLHLSKCVSHLCRCKCESDSYHLGCQGLSCALAELKACLKSQGFPLGLVINILWGLRLQHTISSKALPDQKDRFSFCWHSSKLPRKVKSSKELHQAAHSYKCSSTRPWFCGEPAPRSAALWRCSSQPRHLPSTQPLCCAPAAASWQDDCTSSRRLL